MITAYLWGTPNGFKVAIALEENPASCVADERNPLELLTRKQVATEFGITVKALERFAWAGGGPPMVKLGHRTVRYRRGDIETFIAALTPNR